MPKCDLDACSLSDDIGDIKKNQAAMTKANNTNAVAQGKFVQKMDDFLTQYEKNEISNKEERDILFTRTRDVAKQKDIKGMATYGGILKILGGISIFLGIFATILRLAGVV